MNIGKAVAMRSSGPDGVVAPVDYDRAIKFPALTIKHQRYWEREASLRAYRIGAGPDGLPALYLNDGATESYMTDYYLDLAKGDG